MKMLSSLLVGILLFFGVAQAGNFTDNHTGTVTDNVTGLVWQKEDDKTYRDWDTAITYCENLNLDSYTDWRLPNIKELNSIIDRSRRDPAIDPIFPVTNTNNSYWVQFWSSTTSMGGGASIAWFINFLTGGIGTANKSALAVYVRCVRGGSETK